VSDTDWEKAVAERPRRSRRRWQRPPRTQKQQSSRGEIAELKAQAESDRIDFRLQLAGVRNVKAAHAVLDDRGGDVDALK